MDSLEEHAIPLSDYRVQGYDNAARNTALQSEPFAFLPPFHALNLILRVQHSIYAKYCASSTIHRLFHAL